MGSLPFAPARFIEGLLGDSMQFDLFTCLYKLSILLYCGQSIFIFLHVLVWFYILHIAFRIQLSLLDLCH